MNKTLIITILCALCALFPGLVRADKYWDQKVSLFDKTPVGQNDIVFLGNSITDGGNFEELLNRKDVKNRGIRSDVIPGVRKRLHQVTNGHPRKIFLLIGINDVSHGLSVGELARRYETLVNDIRAKSPETRLYIQSVMPINNDFGVYKNLRGREQTVLEFNREIEKIAVKNGLTYIDLWPALADKDGKLRKEFTNDGLHLLGDGYLAWIAAIRPYLD